MPWTPYEQRPEVLRRKLDSKLIESSTESSSLDFYNAHDLGLISDEALIRYIDDFGSSVSESNLVDVKESTRSSDSGSSQTLKEGEVFSTKSLRYLKNNSLTARDQHYAETLYYDILFDLWRQHVMTTGETYYPPLAEDLFELYRFNQDQV